MLYLWIFFIIGVVNFLLVRAYTYFENVIRSFYFVFICLTRVQIQVIDIYA